ncbi:PREDICTED: apolipoprotein D-like [Ceratosolen solmsi marchali]|uniref:Apolipoprotein D-like n=1 Tax=Ceratosolen solmsi marchali TaxID=326594 RepID=A0AAJ7E1J4_9HYME|nr:PREDICTED: apolipoprotein D-like [Ceratosolen solmsi marchali]
MKSVVALLIVAVAGIVHGQIPSLGFCPEYLPMVGFDMDRFSGIWYEAERYFQLTEVASRCVMSNYTKGPDGKFHVVNEVTSRFTGIKRVLEGEIRKAPSKAEEGKLHVKYTTVPLIPLETQYNVLETDYDNYAVLWSCSGVGPVHTQNAWIMTRQRLAPGEILQKAYGVLDKYKISKVFFVKTNQEDCAYLDSLQAEQAIKPTEPLRKPQIADVDNEDEEEVSQSLASKSAAEIRPHITPDAPEAIIKTRRAEIDAQEAIAASASASASASAEAAQPIVAVAEEAVKSVPEVILKIADQAKEVGPVPVLELVEQRPVVAVVAEEPKAIASIALVEPEKSAETKLEITEDKIGIVKT